MFSLSGVNKDVIKFLVLRMFIVQSMYYKNSFSCSCFFVRSFQSSITSKDGRFFLNFFLNYDIVFQNARALFRGTNKHAHTNIRMQLLQFFFLVSLFELYTIHFTNKKLSTYSGFRYTLKHNDRLNVFWHGNVNVFIFFLIG